MPELFGRALSRRELEARVGSLDQLAGITELTHDTGRGKGVRILRLCTGPLTVEIVADRALDIVHATYLGVPFVWRSANDLAAPAYYDARGDEWLRSFFGGWLTTCGLSNFGPAGSDASGDFGLHGRIDNTPAEQISAVTRWDCDRCVLEVEGTVRETKALSTRLVLRRRWWSELGSATLHLEDRVRNEGGEPAPHMILYHCNAGFPLVDAATRVYVSHNAIAPRDAAAASGLARWNYGGEPQAGFREQVFILEPRACRDGKARGVIVNAGLLDGGGLGFEVTFDPAALPAIFTWRKLGFGDYVMSLEPANTPAIQGRAYAGAHAMLPFLEPGEERIYALEFAALTRDALRESIATIESANATAAAPR
ncbi:MAG: aldose 1-epimerase family protein [Candidatus Eremiobacteraeota bacterium]|nr:aldose 1-epimerase family protein [Candidatus Eremiobacteraeota bacterium]